MDLEHGEKTGQELKDLTSWMNDQPELIEWIEEVSEDALLINGFDDCIDGVVEMYGQPPIVCYDKEKMILKMQRQDGMTREEAEEFFEYNQIGAWVGDTTPCFITKPPDFS